MGLERAKSLLPLKDNLTFLDVIARQNMKANVPLVLMNSFRHRARLLTRPAKLQRSQPAHRAFELCAAPPAKNNAS
ncbi:MAG: UTP--glucose-1-phosphate uridylyltransferase [Chloroflexi bacterium]|nr:UTP--glucose-1-phosphate uridylyltransferase [Chloroflexota bacterium]